MNYLKKQIQEIKELQLQINSDVWITQIQNSIKITLDALKNGKKVIFAGNGGSAADAQHMAGEFVSRFEFDRPGLAALALTVDTSIITACGNDYGYESIFSRQLEAVGSEGDVLWVYTTSGKSQNILKVIQSAKLKKISVIAFCGRFTELLEPNVSQLVSIDSDRTPRIQEWHLISGHLICGTIEHLLFS